MFPNLFKIHVPLQDLIPEMKTIYIWPNYEHVIIYSVTPVNVMINSLREQMLWITSLIARHLGLLEKVQIIYSGNVWN